MKKEREREKKGRERKGKKTLHSLCDLQKLFDFKHNA